MSWMVLESFCGGVTNRSSLRSSVVASLKNEWVRLCALGSLIKLQVGLAGPRLLMAVFMVQPGSAAGSRVSLKLPVADTAHAALAVTKTLPVAVSPRALRSV